MEAGKTESARPYRPQLLPRTRIKIPSMSIYAEVDIEQASITRKKEGNEELPDYGACGNDVTAMTSPVAEIHDDSTISRKGECWGCRHTLAILGCLGMSIMYAMRGSLSIAIVAMVGQQENNGTNTNSTNDACPKPTPVNTYRNVLYFTHTKDPEFDWDERTQGIVLGSFYWGYTATNFIGGRASEYLGGKLVFGVGTTLSAFFHILGPICANISLELFIASRIISGIFQGVTFPAMNTLLATWIPPAEKSKFTTIVFGGLQFGTLISMPISGLLCGTRFLEGWPSVFYVFGGAGLVWGVVWFLLIHDRPENHPRISKAELKFIQAQQDSVKGTEVVPIPWRAVLTSLPFWAVVLASLGDDLGFNTLLSEMPTYFKNIQHFDMNSNGLLSALPFLCMWVIGLVWAGLMDKCTSSGKLSITNVRKLSMAVAMYSPVIGLIGMCFVDCNSTLSVVMLCIVVGLNGCVCSGHMCSNQDIAPNLAGTLLGITNTGAAIMGIVAPALTGLITEGNQTLAAWRWVFLISAGVYAVTNTFFLIFITAEVQPWNDIHYIHEERSKSPKGRWKEV